MIEKISLINTNSYKNNIKKSILKSLTLIDYNFNKKCDEILIKPNLSYYWKSSTGSTTDPKLVEAIIDILRNYYGNNKSIKIIESDASAMRVKYAFKMLGYEKLAHEKNVELYNLSNGESTEKNITVNKRNLKISIPKILLKNNLLINVPKLKVIGITKITCAMKNLFGCLSSKKKYVFHKNINEVIVGINNIIRPDLNIVDGLVALGKYPIKLNLIISGQDTYYVDYVASKILNYNPNSIQYLKLLRNTKNITNLRIMGDDINYYRDMMDAPNRFSFLSNTKYLLKLLSIYASLTGDVIPPFLEVTSE